MSKSLNLSEPQPSLLRNRDNHGTSRGFVKGKHYELLSTYLEEKLNTYWLAKKKEGKRPWLLCHWAPCSPLLGGSSRAWLTASPSQLSQPPVGEGGKAGARPVLTQGRLLLEWVMTAHLTHRGRRSASEERKKPAPLSTAFIIQSFPQPGAATGVWEKHQPRPLSPALPEMWTANPVQRPEGGSEPCSGTLALQRSR